MKKDGNYLLSMLLNFSQHYLQNFQKEDKVFDHLENEIEKSLQYHCVYIFVTLYQYDWSPLIINSLQKKIEFAAEKSYTRKGLQIFNSKF